MIAVLVLGDGLLVLASFLVGYYVRFSSGWLAVEKGIPPFADHLRFSLFVTVIWVMIFRACGLYRDRRGVSPVDEFYSAFVAVVCGVLAALGTAFLLRTYWFSRAVLLLAAAMTVAGMSLWRAILHEIDRRLLARGLGRKRCLIVGAGAAGHALSQRMEELPLGYEIVGLMDVQPTESASHQDGILGSLEELPGIVERESVQTVVIAPGVLSPDEGVQLASLCDSLSVEVKVVPDLFDILKHRGSFGEVIGLPLISISKTRLSGGNRILKRCLDLALSATALLLAGVPMLLIAAAIRLTSRGPVLFIQDRVGLDGKTFQMYKFRTMREDAEVETGPVWAARDDPRRTRIGALLRRFSLDELPQLFNVLRGDMSLVGPRPERPHFVEQFREFIPRYMERHRVKSGLTGWAQVNRLRGNSSVLERTIFDLYYVENWSLMLDLKILVKTAFEILFHKEAV